MSSYLNMGGFNTPRLGMSRPNGAQNRAFGSPPTGIGTPPAWSPPVAPPSNSGGSPTKGWWQEGGSGQSPWGGGSIYDNPYGQDALFRLLQTFYGGAANSGAFASNWAEPRFQQGIQDLYGMLSPSGAASRYGQFKNAALANAQSTGNSQAQQLKSLGFSDSTQAGATINQQNNAVEDANSYWQQIADPLAQEQQKLGVLSQAGNSPSVDAIMKLLGLGAGNEPQRGPSIFESLIGGAGAAAGMGWNPFARGAKK